MRERRGVDSFSHCFENRRMPAIHGHPSPCRSWRGRAAYVFSLPPALCLDHILLVFGTRLSFPASAAAHPVPPGLRSLPLPFHSVRRRLQQHLPSSLLLVSISVSTSRPRVPLSIASTKFTQLLLCASFHARLQVYQSDKTWSLPSRSFCSSGGSGDRGRRDCSRKRCERAWGGWRTTRGV